MILAAAAVLFASLASAGRWEKKPAALLYFDADGALSQEIHLGVHDDGARAASGATSPDGRLAWSYEKITSWNAGRTRVTGVARRLRFFSSDGKVLWESAEADEPLEGGAPLLFSADGGTVLVAERLKAGWRVVARTFLGTPIMEAGLFPELHEAALTSDGKYVMARWTVPDQSATHTFLALPSKTRKDVPTSQFPLGKAALENGGKVTAGKKLVFDLATAVSEGEKKP